MKNILKVVFALLITSLPFSFSYPLPIELSYFTASVNLNIVSLNWGTASETNNSGFRIERKGIDSTNWIEVGFVAGNGTTSKPHDYVFEESGLMNGSYNYRLKQIDFNGIFTYHNLNQVVVIKTVSITYLGNSVEGNFKLYQNYPNPFNPATKINYNLALKSFVSLKVFDMLGNEVTTLVNENQIAGYYTIGFNSSNLSSGVYFYKMTAARNGVQQFEAIKRMMVVK